MATIHEMHPQTHLLAAARPRPEAGAPLSSSPVDCYELLAANAIPPGVAIASAYGGRLGVAVMVLVAAFIGLLLATGGVL